MEVLITRTHTHTYQVKLLLVNFRSPQLLPAIMPDAGLPGLHAEMATFLVDRREQRVQRRATYFFGTNLESHHTH